MINDDAVDLIRDILERVGDPFEVLEDLAGDDELDGAGLAIFLEGLLEAGGMVTREEPVADIIKELVDEAAAALESRG